MRPRSSGTSAPLPSGKSSTPAAPASEPRELTRAQLTRERLTRERLTGGTSRAVGVDRETRALRSRHAPQAPAGTVVPAAHGHCAAPGARRVAARARLRGSRARDLHRAASEGGRARPRPARLGAARNRTHPGVRIPVDGAAVRALGPVRRAGAAAGPVADRRVAVPGRVRSAGVRRRQRRTLLELLPLLRLARVCAAVRVLAARAATSG